MRRLFILASFSLISCTGLHAREIKDICDRGVIGAQLAKILRAADCSQVPIEKLQTLRQLELREIGYARIPLNAFKDLHSVEVLTVYGGYRGAPTISIQPGMFADMGSLRELVMKKVSIEKLQENSFTGLSSLRTLVLRDTQVAEVEVGAFRSLSNLRLLDLSVNPIKVIREGAFLDLGSLKRLNLQSSLINEIEPHSFASLSSLKSLSISSHFLPRFNAETFTGLFHLQTLYFGGESVNGISAEAFSPLINLTNLTIDLGRYPSLEGHPFRFLKNLKILKLSSFEPSYGQGLRQLRAGDFAGLVNLEELSLTSHYYLESIKPLTFVGLSKLKKLDLSRNKLNVLPALVFSELLLLEELTLLGNSLTSISRSELGIDPLVKVDIPTTP